MYSLNSGQFTSFIPSLPANIVSSTIETTGDISVGGNLDTTGRAIIDGKLGVGMTPVNNLDVTGTLGTTGAADIGGTLEVNGVTTFNAETNYADNLMKAAKIQDYSETVNPLGNTTGNITIDLASGNVVTATCTGITNWTFSGTAASGTACGFTLILRNGGAYAQNWPNTVDWPGGTPPTMTASGYDIVSFMTLDAGTTWYGVVSSKDVK